MRSTKELLEVLLDQYQNNRIDGIQWAGLCFAIIRIDVGHVIDQYEKEDLFDVIKANRPESAAPFYWWPKGEVEPRVKFIEQLISKLENET